MRILTIGLLFLSTALWAQPDSTKIVALSKAIAKAEGFGIPHAIPTRTHNPGDFRTTRFIPRYLGQVGINAHGYVIFKNDAAGWAALQDYILKIAEGRSRHYSADMTLAQLSNTYARRWQPWLRIATKELGVSPKTRLSDLLGGTMSNEQPTDAHPTDNPDIWENQDGFFFSDETELLNGPYPTKQDAIINLNAYADWLTNGPKAVNTTANLPQSTVKYYGG